jgi:hypothetical protein
MNIWFTRSNGDTPLNNPKSLDYVAGEPPKYPKKEYNYRLKCLDEGFARIGWPNTGNLTVKNPIRLAPKGYSFESIEKLHKNYLIKFKSIKAGDFVLIPADDDRGEVHLGIVLTKDRLSVKPYLDPRPDAYYHYFDLSKGDWYECAHRVNVKWAKTEGQDFAVFTVKAVEGVMWIKAFGKVEDDGTIFQLAKKANLFQ